MFIKNRRLFAHIILCSLISTTAFGMHTVPTVSGLYNRATSALRNIRNRFVSICGWPVRQAQNQFNRLGTHLENHADTISNRIENRMNAMGNTAQQYLDNLIWNGIFGVAAIATTFFVVKYLWHYFAQ